MLEFHGTTCVQGAGAPADEPRGAPRPRGSFVRQGTKRHLPRSGSEWEGVMTKSEMFRQHAQSCLRLAEATTSPDHKASLVTMAQAWHQLAQDQERAEQRVVGTSEEASPNSIKS